MKNFFLFLLWMFLISSFSFAAEWIKDISLKFCNDGTWDKMTPTYTAMLEPWQQKELCIYVENTSTWSVIMKYNFPKATLSKWWNQICDTSDDFAKFLLDNPKREITIPWNSAVILKEIFAPSPGMIGMYYGCLAYQLQKPEVEGMWWMFDLVIRKASNLNLFVGSEESISNTIQLTAVTWSIFSTNKHVSAYYNEDGDLILNLSVKNNGNVSQNVSLSGKFYNPLGFEKPFTVPVKKMLPGDTYQMSVNIGIVPFYKWLFSVRISLTGEPVFEFNASGIDEKYKQPTIIKETWSLFIFSWVYIIVALVLLAVIIKIVVPRKKIVNW